MSEVKPIPDNYPRLDPYLWVYGGDAASEFYTRVLGASERGGRLRMPDGGVGHAELELGDALLMLSDEAPEMGIVGPRAIGGTPVTLNLYVEDVDAVFAKAIEAGAKQLRPVEDQFYGDRSGQFEDPFGHRWSVSTHVEDVSPEEMQSRVADAMGG